MEKETAEMIWEAFVSHKSMLMMPKRNELLKPAQRQVNLLGSVKKHKEKFLKAMEGVKL